MSVDLNLPTIKRIIRTHSNKMNTYGLVGYPLGHSFSRNFFGEKFAKENIDAEYLNFEIPSIELLPQVLTDHPNLCGFNVTIPYKQQVMAYLNDISQEARAIGAVNVVKVTRKEGRTELKGFNSDVSGFVNSITPLLQPHHKKALILGTGGASKAICFGLKEKLNISPLFVSRTAKDGAITYADIDSSILNEYEVIVNCTPSGMYPHTDECPPLPYHLLTPRHLLYDLVYNPEETLFMKKGAAQGATVKNGLEMLILQAIASWEIWNEQCSEQ